MRINNNLMAMNTHRQLGIVTDFGAKATEKLSSGYRINRAGDDAAGLAISEKMRGQIRGLTQASRNSQDGISLIQTAEGALNETHAILQRMRELANQAATDTNTLDDRKEIQKEINQLLEEIDRIGDQTEFNTQKLLDGTFEEKWLHIGANQNQNMQINIANMKTDNIGSTEFTGGEGVTSTGSIITNFEDKVEITISGLEATDGGDDPEVTIELEGDYGSAAKVVDAINEQIAEDSNYAGKVEAKLLDGNKITFIAKDANATYEVGEVEELFIEGGEIDNEPAFISSLKVDDVETATAGGVLTQGGANEAITIVDDAIKGVSAERSKLGAIQNRLEHTIKNLDTSAENLQASESRIRDVDMAQEMMEFTKQNILQQASTAMLAQANMAPQSVLQLLR